ncbi:MAG: hypothetical protein HZB65_00955 [Candidatus Aenigmarchaeota archaeon]|nr:hypothetical protein [Candidatus Aenigmarchaeota archaeon]
MKYNEIQQEILNDAKRRMQYELGERRQTGTLSKAHAEDHCEAVAKNGALIAYALMLGQNYHPSDALQIAFLTELAGYLHDIKRESTEFVPHGPLASKYFRKIVFDAPYSNLSSSLQLSPVREALDKHELSFGEILNIFGNPINKKRQIDVSSEIIAMSVVMNSILAADKALEASGYRVVERRSFFVGRERAMNEFKYHPIFNYSEGSAKAVLGETLIRLYTRNSIDEYPDWLKPTAQSLHAVQYLWLQGLLSYYEITEENAAKFMLENRFTKFDQKLVDKISTEKHLDGKHFSHDQYPILFQGIERIGDISHDQNGSRDLAESSIDIIRLFLQEADPKDAIDHYFSGHESNLKYLDRFMRGIKEYRDGSGDFAKNLMADIQSEAKRIAFK